MRKRGTKLAEHNLDYINELPKQFSKKELELIPPHWRVLLVKYKYSRKKALKEEKPAFCTFITMLMAAIVTGNIKLVDKAIKLTEDNIPKNLFLFFVGSILCDFGQKEDGLAFLRDLVELDPSSRYILALATDTEDMDEKENLAKKVLEENPKNYEALRHLAHAKYFKGEKEEAVHIIDELLSNEPNNMYALEYRGNVYFDEENYDQALQRYLKIKRKYKSVDLKLRICHCYYRLGKIKKAKKIANKFKGKLNSVFNLDLDITREEAEEILAEVLNA